MIKKLLIVIGLLISAKLFPQEINQSVAYNPNAIKFVKYQKMETTGIVLMTAGGIALIGGAYLFINNFSAYENQVINRTQQPNINTYLKIAGGEVLLDIGAIALGGGTALFIIGHNKKNKYSNKLTISALPNYFKVAYTF